MELYKISELLVIFWRMSSGLHRFAVFISMKSVRKAEREDKNMVSTWLNFPKKGRKKFHIVDAKGWLGNLSI